MIDNNSLYSAIFEFLGTPLSPEELETLHLPDASMSRLRQLLQAEQMRSLTACEQADLEAFKEAAFYLRMGGKQYS